MWKLNSRKVQLSEAVYDKIVNRIFDRKDQILKASHQILDLIHQYETELENPKCDNREIVKQIEKQLFTIMSCLGDLTPFVTNREQIAHLKIWAVKIIGLLLGEHSESLLTYAALTQLKVLCAFANLVGVTFTKRDFKVAFALKYSDIEAALKVEPTTRPKA